MAILQLSSMVNAEKPIDRLYKKGIGAEEDFELNDVKADLS